MIDRRKGRAEQAEAKAVAKKPPKKKVKRSKVRRAKERAETLKNETRARLRRFRERWLKLRINLGLYRAFLALGFLALALGAGRELFFAGELHSWNGLTLMVILVGVNWLAGRKPKP